MLILDQLKKNDPELRALTAVVLTGMSILLVGLYYVQVVASKHFVADQQAQSFRTVRIPAVRGRILDRSGQALAENRPSYDVSLFLDELRDRFTYEYTNQVIPAYLKANPNLKRIARSALPALREQARYQAASNIVRRLAHTLGQTVTLEPDDFHRHYTDTRALPLPVIRNLAPTDLARFLEEPNPAFGVDLDVQPNRVYPCGSSASHLLGYLTRDTRSALGEDAFVNYRLPDYSGSIGIEWAFDQHLRGKGGVKSVLVNSLGYRQSETIWTPAEPGQNVILTLDLDIQLQAEQALQSVGPDPHAAAVVLDPQTGDVLAMASLPGFDPGQFLPRISHDQYKQLIDPVRRPLINRAIQENYPPGSIFKIITGLACLEAGLDPQQEIYNPGHIRIGRRLIDDLAAPGQYNFKRAFLKSSNTYFITNGLRAGAERIIRLGRAFALGERTGIPTGQEVPGNFPSLEEAQRRWFDGDTANLCIGQGPIDVTPVQIAVMVAAIANGGRVLIPRLVARIESQDPNSDQPALQFPAPRVRSTLDIDPRYLQLVRQAMLADVEDPEGTGRASAVPGWRVCGKTGTAQRTDPRGFVKNHIAWFASYAPDDHPRYVVVVMVENGASGGETCAPVARKIYAALQARERGQAPPPPSVAQSR